MPTPRRRAKKVRTKRKHETEISISLNLVSLSAKRFRKLRSDPDFITVIRVGRLINALSFTEAIARSPVADSKWIEQRNRFRTSFVNAGYLYEGLLLIDSLSASYRTEPTFSKLEALIRGNSSDRRREIVKTIRDGAAFHLDWKNKSVIKAVGDLRLKSRYDLYSGDGDTMRDFYFNLGDLVDLNYIVDELKGDQSEPKTVREIFKAIDYLMVEMSFGAHEFISFLVTKLGIVTKGYKS